VISEREMYRIDGAIDYSEGVVQKYVLRIPLKPHRGFKNGRLYISPWADGW